MVKTGKFADAADAPDQARRAFVTLAAIAMLPLAGCGGGGGSDDDPPAQTLELYWDGLQGWDQLKWY